MGKKNDANVGFFETYLEDCLVRTEDVYGGVMARFRNRLKPSVGSCIGQGEMTAEF